MRRRTRPEKAEQTRKKRRRGTPRRKDRDAVEEVAMTTRRESMDVNN
jgi:hypothetical protein